MKLVIVKQEQGKYLFAVPSGNIVYAGEMLLIDTARGNQVGTALCDSFDCDDKKAKIIMSAFNTEEKKMKYAIGKCIHYMFDMEVKDGDL